MPKRKISVEEAFAALEQAGIQVQVKKVSEEIPLSKLEDFLEKAVEPSVLPVQGRIGSTTVKLMLYAKHTVGSGGSIIKLNDGSDSLQNAGIETYGPGICYVPASLAQHLAHQDALARKADDRLHDRKFRSYVVVQRSGGNGVQNVGIQVSDDIDFDLSAYIGSLDARNFHHIG